MIQNRIVTVFGAYGHTGRFVVSELRKRGFTPILSGRDAAKLKEAGNVHPGSEVRVASVDDPASLDRALSGAMAVINCAGPFNDTAGPVIDAALRRIMVAWRTLMLHHLWTADDVLKSRHWVLRFAAS